RPTARAGADQRPSARRPASRRRRIRRRAAVRRAPWARYSDERPSRRASPRRELRMLTTPGRWPECTATSFASRIERGEPGRCQVALLGLPDDVGVQLNGGRVGARAGPTAFREALCRFGTPYDGLSRRELTTRVYDA